MYANIVGIENKSYQKKETGELIEMFAVYLVSKPKTDKAVGQIASCEMLTGLRNADSLEQIKKLGEKNVIGKPCFISKGVNTFGGKSYVFVEEFEIIEK